MYEFELFIITKIDKLSDAPVYFILQNEKMAPKTNHNRPTSEGRFCPVGAKTFELLKRYRVTRYTLAVS